MCRHVSPVQTRTKFVILMHPKEFKKVKNNTGYLTKLSLPNSELFIGINFSSHHRVNEIIETHKSYILFPSLDALNLSSQKLQIDKHTNEKEIAIFLIDSTWSCTKSILNQSKNLKTLNHLSFETQRVSQYDIKQQPQKNYLSTIESTHVVLELLNLQGIEEIKEKELENFLNPFFNMIQYQKELIANPKSHAVRFKKKRVELF